MISDVISIVNLVAIVILYILFFTKNSKENFTGAPSGYTNLLVSDDDGNLNTFSMSTLENDIDSKIQSLSDTINATLTGYQTKGDYVTTSTLTNGYQTKGDYVTTSTLTNGYQPKGNYVNVDKIYSIFTPTGIGQTGGHDTNIGYLYGSGNDWGAAWNGNGQSADKNLQWAIREWPPPQTTIEPA